MGCNIGFRGLKEERKQLSFFKIFQAADLSSETMRSIPYNFMRNLSDRDFSEKMVIRAPWGSWKINISQNPSFYYMERRGWEKFVSENLLGENELVIFTHRGMMSFTVNIFEHNGTELLTPRRSPTSIAPPSSSKRIKTEPVESTPKDVKKEVEEIGESLGGVKRKVRMRKLEDFETPKTTKKKQKTTMSMPKSKPKEGEENTVHEFTITIKKSYLRCLGVPKQFAERHIHENMYFKIHRPDGTGSWNVYCLVGKNGTLLSSGWSKMAREYPLALDDICTLKLTKPNELLLVLKPKADETTMINEV